MFKVTEYAALKVVSIYYTYRLVQIRKKLTTID